MKTRKNPYLSLITVFILLFQLINPALVYADSETPPPPSDTPVQAPTTLDTLVPTKWLTPEATATKPSDLTPTDSVTPTLDPIETSTSHPTPKDTLAPADIPASTDSATSTIEPVETKTLEPTLQDTPVIANISAPTDTFTQKVEPVGTSTPDPTQDATPVATETPLPTESVTEVLPSEAPTKLVTPAVSNSQTKTPTPEPPTEALELTASTPDAIETSTPLETNITEQSTMLETVQTISKDTSIVVLDENGQPLPLVTQDAAQAITNGDPIWCPAGQAPTPGTNGCTDSYYFGSVPINTMALLLGLYGPYINNQNVNGTIWITSGFIPDLSPVAIDGAIYPNWANYSLTLQGGWCGTYGTVCANGSSVFSVPMTITNWNNNVAVSLVDVQNGDLSLSNVNGNVTLSNVNGNVDINNVNAPQISLSNSTITNGGRIALTGVDADVNLSNIHVEGAAGSALGVTVNGNHNVTITDSQFINNRADYNVPSYPWGDGADIFSNNGTVNVTVNNSEFSGNDWGLWVQVGNLVSIANSLFDRNNRDIVVGCSSGNGIGLDFPDSFKIDVNINPDCTYTIPTPTPPPGPTPTPPPGTTPTPVPTPVLPVSTTTITDIKNNFARRVPSYSSKNISYEGGKAEFYLDCSNQDLFKINLPNGDKVDIYCPVTGKARITRVDNTTLPKELPAGYTFASAFQVDILQPVIPLQKLGSDYVREPIPVIRGEGHITASFVATPLQAGKTFSILYWDESASQWMQLQDFVFGRSFKLIPAAPEDKREILSGVIFRTNNDPQRVDVSTNFPGIFVLAQY